MRADSTIDFADEETKKYLRMMMHEAGDVLIRFDPKTQDGFRLGLLEDFGLLSEAEDPAQGANFNPMHASNLEAVEVLATEEREIAASHCTMPTRPQTVSYQLLTAHARYTELLADVMIEKAKGNEEKVKELSIVFIQETGKMELKWERYFDHFMAAKNISAIVNKVGKQLV